MGIITRIKTTRSHGFTLIEILVVVSVIGILLGLAVVNFNNSPEKARITKADNELTVLANAVNLYVYNNGTYPPDGGDAGFPSAISKYISDTNLAGNLPAGPWQGSKYDFDAWSVDPASGGQIDTVQVSIRFCTYAEYSGPGGPTLCKSRVPNGEPWSTTFTSNNNAYYYCIKGYCRSNGSAPISTPGYCTNCTNHAPIPRPSDGQ